MASPNLYVRSTDGSDADNGTTWALAKATISGAAAIDSTTDNRIWVSQAHSETAASPTWNFAGTNAIPTWLVAANDGAEPPTSVSTATVAPSSGSITVNGSCYVRGLTMITAVGLKFANGAADVQTYEACNLHFTGSGNSQFGPANTTNANTFVRLRDTNLKTLSTSSNIMISGRVEIDGGAMLAGSSVVTGGIFVCSNDRTHSELLVSGFDFSALGTTHGVFGINSGAASVRFVARKCKFASGWSGAFVTGTILPGQRFEMHNCDAGDTNYRLLVKDYGGDLTSETTVVRTSGASDGTTKCAWKIATTSNAKYPMTGIVSPERSIWNTTVGSSQTAAVEILHFAQGAGTNGALQDDEIALEVQYLGTSGYPLSAFSSSAKADVLAAAASHTTTTEAWDSIAAAYSSATNYVVGDIVRPSTPNGALYLCTIDAGTTGAEPTWGTTDGGTTVDAAGRTWVRSNRQKLTRAFTAQEAGPLLWRVVAYKASKTIYVDPKVSGVT